MKKSHCKIFVINAIKVLCALLCRFFIKFNYTTLKVRNYHQFSEDCSRYIATKGKKLVCDFFSPF